MTIDDKIRDEKLQYDINREAAKISALSSDKIHKYEYLNGEDILLTNKQQIIEQAKFTYSPLGKAFEKQIKTIEDQGKKQVMALNTLKSDDNELTIEDVIPKSVFVNDGAKKELDKIKEIEKNADREKLSYETDEHIYSFKNFQTMQTFGRDIYNGEITLQEVENQPRKLINEMFETKSQSVAPAIDIHAIYEEICDKFFFEDLIFLPTLNLSHLSNKI